jgi:hypothetical protein
VERAGYGDYFIHRTGHSIGEAVHGNAVNIDNLETRDERELVPMITEWRRVLKTGGRMHIRCPDIRSAAQFIGLNGVDAVVYTTDEGIPIRGHDILFGYVGYIANQGEPMRHKSALDIRKLAHVLHQAGFDNGTVTQNGGWFALSATAIK